MLHQPFKPPLKRGSLTSAFYRRGGATSLAEKGESQQELRQGLAKSGSQSVRPARAVIAYLDPKSMWNNVVLGPFWWSRAIVLHTLEIQVIPQFMMVPDSQQSYSTVRFYLDGERMQTNGLVGSFQRC